MSDEFSKVITSQPLRASGEGISPSEGLPNEIQLPPPPPSNTNKNKTCRPGFEPFLNVDNLILKQRRADRVVSREEFKILLPTGEEIFSVYDESDHSERLLRASRLVNFVVQIGNICTLKGDIGTSCFTPGTVVLSSNRQPLGSVVQTGFRSTLAYELRERSGVTGITLEAGSCSNFCGCMGCCTSVDFMIFDNSNGQRQQIGSIGKVWGGAFTELYTTADVFSVKFPVELDASKKALLVAATILIDYQYYQQK